LNPIHRQPSFAADGKDQSGISYEAENTQHLQIGKNTNLNHHGIVLGYTDPEDMALLEKAKTLK
jgi:hypothetical protein